MLRKNLIEIAHQDGIDADQEMFEQAVAEFADRDLTDTELDDVHGGIAVGALVLLFAMFQRRR